MYAMDCCGESKDGLHIYVILIPAEQWRGSRHLRLHRSYLCSFPLFDLPVLLLCGMVWSCYED